MRSVYIRECSQMLQMEEKILVEATAKLIEQARETRFKEEQRRQQRESRQQTTAYHTESTTGNNTYIPVPSPAEPPAENQVPVPPASEFLPEEYGSQPVLPENILLSFWKHLQKILQRCCSTLFPIWNRSH